MFETVINGLLVRFLSPYVEGLSEEKLSIGFGNFEMKDLQLKSNIFATLGVDAFELEHGTLGCIQIQVPLSALISGKIRVSVQGLKLVARTTGGTAKSDEESLAQLRKNRVERVTTSAAQISELRRHQQVVEAAKKAGTQVDDKAGFGAKLARQLIGNITVDVSRINMGLKDTVVNSEFMVSLGKAFIRGPDATPSKTESEQNLLTKEVGFEEFGVVGGVSPNPPPLLYPLNLKLAFTHNPSVGEVSLGFSLGDAEDTGAALSAEQLRLFSATMQRISQESNRLQELLTPPGTAELVDLGTSESVDATEGEFVGLVRREKRADLDLADGLSELDHTEHWRLGVLWDVVPEQLLARWYVPVFELLEEVRKKREAEEAAKKRRHSLLGMMFGGGQEEEKKKEVNHEEEFDSLRIEAEALESLQSPTKIHLEVYLLNFMFELGPGVTGNETLICAILKGSVLGFQLTTKTDYRGVPSAEWSFAGELQTLSVLHRGEQIFKFGGVRALELDRSPVRSDTVDLDGTSSRGSKLHETNSALRMSVENSLQEDSNTLAVTLELEPMELFWISTMIPALQAFAKSVKPGTKFIRDMSSGTATQAKDAVEKSMDKYFDRGEEWLNSEQGQQMLKKAKDRIPDSMELHIRLSGPRVKMPITGKSGIWVSSGTLSAETPSSCTTQDFRLQVALSDMALTVADETGFGHKVMSPFTIDTFIQSQDGDASVDVEAHELQFQAAPEVARILLLVPKVLKASAQPPADADTPEDGPEEEDADTQATEQPKVERDKSSMRKKAGEYLALIREKATDIDVVKDHSFRVSLQMKRLTVLLLDVVAPVLRAEASIKDFEVTYCGGELTIPLEVAPKGKEDETGSFPKGNRQAIQFGLECFNVRVGRFEPLLERMELTCQMSQTAEDRRIVRMLLLRPLYVNLTPSSLRLLPWYLQHFVSVLTSSDAAILEARPRYQMLNLSKTTLVLSSTKTGENYSVEPTGGSCHSLDDWVMKLRSDKLELIDGKGFSLNQVAALRLRGTLRIVQVLKPQPQCTILLVSSPVLMFNETTLAIEFRGSSRLQARGFSWGLARTNCATSAFLLGGSSSPHAPTQDLVDGQLGPGEFASIDVDPHLPKEEGRFQVSWEIQPAGGKWSDVQVPGQDSVVPVDSGDLRVLAMYEDVKSPPPSEQPFLHVKLLPAMRLRSGLPCTILVEYGLTTESQAPTQTITIPEFSDAAIYDIKTPAQVSLRFQLEGGSWSSWARVRVGFSDTNKEGTEVELSAPASNVASVGFTVTVQDVVDVSVHCPTWLVDRTGCVSCATHQNLPMFNAGGVYLCPNTLSDYKLHAQGLPGPAFSIPAIGEEYLLVEALPKQTLCVRSVKLPKEEAYGCNIRCLELLPGLIIHNGSSTEIEFSLSADTSVPVAAGSNIAIACSKGTNMRFRPARSGDWSMPFPVFENSFCPTPFSLGLNVWTVEIRPDKGVSCVMLQAGSNYSLQNNLDEPCVVTLRGLPPFEVPANGEQMFGWLDPLGADAGRCVQVSHGDSGPVSFDPHVSQSKPLGQSALVKSSKTGSCTCLEICPAKSHESKQPTTTIELMLHKTGISLVGEHDGSHELLYFEMDLLRACVVLKPDEDLQLLDFSIADIQLDWQSAPSQNFAVVFGNSGASSSSVVQPFFRLVLERGRTSSPDINIRAMRVDIDEFEVTANDVLLAAVQRFIHDAFPAQTTCATIQDRSGTLGSKIRLKAGHEVLEDGWVEPPPQKMMKIKEMLISNVKMTVWCSLRLQFLTFLPVWVKALVTSLTFSRSLALEGATLQLECKPFAEVSGSFKEVGQALGRQYTGDVLRSLGSVLGNSSVLNVPRAPLKLVGAVAHGGDGVFKVGDKFAAGFQSISFDADYIERQKRLREKRQINSIGQGFTAAISDIGDGFDGMLDIVRKPIAGARESGFGGGAEGLGKGMLSSVVKPLNAVGNAMSDIGRGLSASIQGVASKGQKVTQRRRLPRLLAGPLGAVVEYSALDAWVLMQLSRRIEIIVPLGHHQAEQQENADADRPSVLLLLVITPDNVLLEWMTLPPSVVTENVMEADFALLSRLRNLPVATEDGIVLEGAPKPKTPTGTLFHSCLPLSEVHWQESGEPGVAPEIALVALIESVPLRFLMPVPWEMGNELAQALFAVMTASCAPVEGDWTASLRQALSRARQAAVGQGEAEVTETVVVFEVERAEVASGSSSTWRRPFLPNEVEQSYRWMDKDLMRRHPLLDPAVDASACDKPPVVMLPIWTPSGEWQVEHPRKADKDGWQYGTNWGTSAWSSAPRPLFDTVRRRKWVRKYKLHMLSNDDEFIGNEWLHAKPQDRPNMWALCCAMTCCARVVDKSKKKKSPVAVPTVSTRSVRSSP